MRNICPSMMMFAVVPAVAATLPSSAFAMSAADNLPSAIKLGAPFGDNMVLQRDMDLPVWGWSKPGTMITVAFAGQKKTATAGKDGKWLLKLDPMPACTTGRTLSVKSAIRNQQSEITDVLVGDVWICSGQSNMEWPVKSLQGRYQEDIAAANDSWLRLGRVTPLYAARPLEHTEASWQPCTPEQALDFSAGADRKFVEAGAIIEGDTVVVSSPVVERPVAVRFAFGSADIPNLMNKAGLPASSFRTDNWPGNK